MAFSLTFFALFVCCLAVTFQAVVRTVNSLNEFASEKRNCTVRKWALLVAGSSGWYNYRHQADVCHAYQVLHKHGIPDDRIVVMMYDDIANNSQNPDKGKIINHPNGSNVYHGVPHDYVKQDVTPENFLKILAGDKQAMHGIGSGKVIDGDSDDHIFLFYSDHGAVGMVGFPHSILKAGPFQDTLKSMWKAKKYGKMVIYIESCESGSMLDSLDPQMKKMRIFATTASNAKESSYACYMDERLDTYLGDLYSVNWMEDSDKENLLKETLEEQYQIVKAKTNRSHVQQYGDMKISPMSVARFQGSEKTDPIAYPAVPIDAVDSRNVPISVLEHMIKKYENNPQMKYKYMKELGDIVVNRALFDRQLHILEEKFSAIGSLSSTYRPLKTPTQRQCHEQLIDTFVESCYSFSQNPYTMKGSKLLARLCANGVKWEEANRMLQEYCDRMEKPVGYIL